MNDAGVKTCDVPENATFLEFLKAGEQDCVYDFGDAGTRTFILATNDEWKEQKMAHKKTQNTETEHKPEPESQPSATSITMPPVVGQMTASVGVPDNAIAEVKSLVPAGGDASMITVALAVVGVAGGGAAIKLYQNMVKSKHDQEMKRLEIEEKRSEKQDDQHQQCNVARAALEAKVAALTTRIEDLSARKSESPSLDLGDFDPEALEERLKKIEAALKTAKAKKR
jgi:hypothetical protein